MRGRKSVILRQRDFNPGSAPLRRLIELDLAYLDELTEVPNRRYYASQFMDMAVRATHTGDALAMAVVDMDYFKSINDSYGHAAGDGLLREMGALLRDACGRTESTPIRYGGDEFVILMPGLDRDAAVLVVQGLAQRLNDKAFRMDDEREVHLTISAGVAAFPEDVNDPQALFAAADAAVYRSKREGRNRISVPNAGEVPFTRDNFHRLFPCPKLVGRNDILSQMKPYLMLQPGAGRPIIALTGPSGVGKTRLLETWQSMTDTQRSAIVWARGLPDLVNQPYGAILEAVRFMTRADTRLAHRIASGLSPRELRAIYPLLPDIAGVGMFSADGGVDPGPEQTGRSLITSILVKILILLSDGKPLTIFVDDLQWCEAGTVEVLEELKSIEEGRSALVVLGLRKTGDQLGGEGQKAVFDFVVNAMKARRLLPIEVEPLSWHHVRDMISAILPALSTHERLIQIVTQKSKALPLLVEEILKFLIQQEYVVVRDGEVHVKEFGEDDIPARIEDILALRSMNLSAELREFVARAAVVGNKFDLHTLKELDGASEGELLDSIDKGVRTSFLQADSPDEFRFVSDDAQEALYEQVDKTQRIELHARMAEIEEKRAGSTDSVAARLAFHLERAGNPQRAAKLLTRLARYQEESAPESTRVAATGPVSAFVQQIAEDASVLLKDLESGNPDKISAAAKALLGRGEAVIEPLLGLVSSTEDLRARRVALHCLNHAGCPVLDRLLEAVHRTQDYAEKCRLISCLGEFREAGVAAGLEAFIRFPEASVRRQALRVVEQLGGETGAAFVLYASTDRNEGIQNDAIASLGRMRWKAAVPQLIQLIRPRTIFFFDAHRSAQRYACMALGAIRDASARKPLMLALRRNPWWSLKRTKDPQIRAAAAMALTAFSGQETEAELKRASCDSNHVVRSAAKVALNKLRGELSVQDSEELAQLDATTRAEIEELLGREVI